MFEDYQSRRHPGRSMAKALPDHMENRHGSQYSVVRMESTSGYRPKVSQRLEAFDNAIEA